MRPQEWQELAEMFDRAVEWNEADMLVKRSRLAHVNLIESGSEELILGGEFPYERYSLVPKQQKNDQVSITYPVVFLIVPWNRGYRLLGIEFGPESVPRDIT